MLIEILRMPPVFGIPIDRRVNIQSGFNPNLVDASVQVHWSAIPLYYPSITAGSYVERTPQQVYKAIHVSHDGKYVFETVFSIENTIVTCIYTKVISHFGVEIAISLNAIAWYQNYNIEVKPISHFIATADNVQDNYYEIELQSRLNALEAIVPPIFGVDALARHAAEIMDVRQNNFSAVYLNQVYRPIWEYVPVVFESLVEGAFRTLPTQHIMTPHPSIQIVLDKWFNYEQVTHSNVAFGRSGQHIITNHVEFDEIVLDILRMTNVKFCVTCRMDHAVDGIVGLWVTQTYDDPYQSVLHGPSVDVVRYNESLSKIFYKCAMVYCRLYSVDSKQYIDNAFDYSSITIDKNIYDEIVITFHDIIRDQYVSFYSSFPALALATRSVAGY